MKLAAAKEFTTKLRFNGILPALPWIPGADEGSVPRYLKEVANADNLFPKGFGPRQGDDNRDSYWDGKNLGRTANLPEIAEHLGLKRERDRFLTASRTSSPIGSTAKRRASSTTTKSGRA